MSANGERLLHRLSKCISFHVFVNNGRVYLNFTRFADCTQAQVNILIKCLFFYGLVTHFVFALVVVALSSFVFVALSLALILLYFMYLHMK